MLKKSLDKEQVCHGKYLNTKIKYNGKCRTNFHYNAISSKDNTEYACLLIVMIDSVGDSVGENYYPQALLEECKYAVL